MLDELTYIQQELSSVWPDWTITKKIGKGSFGTVYEITRNDLGRTYSCALKVLHMETGDNGLYYDSESGAAGMEDSDLTDDGSEGSWYWVDGTPFSFESWLEGQPDGLGDTENYALFWYKDVPYKWNDGDFGKDAEGRVTFLIEWDQ